MGWEGMRPGRAQDGRAAAGGGGEPGRLPGADGRMEGGGRITLAKGHAIERRAVQEKLEEFRSMPMKDVLSMAKSAWEGVRGYAFNVKRKFFKRDGDFDIYGAAMARKDWSAVNQLFLDELAHNPARYGRFMEVEATMYALSLWLCRVALESDCVHRWIDPPEIESFLGGTFESRVEADNTRRGFKALTVNSRLWFGRRGIWVKVPVDGSARQAIRCVRYTALPRIIEEKDERIGDPKSAEYVTEAETRVADGTPVPAGTQFAVAEDAMVDDEVVKMLEEKYNVIRLDGQEGALLPFRT